MDIKYPIENKYKKCVLQIDRFSGLRPGVRSSLRGRVRGGVTFSLVSEPRFRRFYKLIFEIVCDMHCICI